MTTSVRNPIPTNAQLCVYFLHKTFKSAPNIEAILCTVILQSSATISVVVMV